MQMNSTRILKIDGHLKGEKKLKISLKKDLVNLFSRQKIISKSTIIWISKPSNSNDDDQRTYEVFVTANFKVIFLKWQKNKISLPRVRLKIIFVSTLR